jgi:phosphopantothenoylcysteine decarboxylase/phosphopantothenate--cysteine ligase
VARIVETALRAATPPSLAGRRIVVSAGPTVEDIDPARTITNRSSGKMGLQVARALALRGATVELVRGPVTVAIPDTPGIVHHPVRSAAQMAERVFALTDSGVDAVVMAAAVADFTPTNKADQKLKKQDGPPTITLSPTTDILATLGARADRPFALVGFAAETQHVERAAAEKRVRKGCDVVVGNDVGAGSTGFDVDTNRLYFARRDAAASQWTALLSKESCAEAVADEVEGLLRG